MSVYSQDTLDALTLLNRALIAGGNAERLRSATGHVLERQRREAAVPWHKFYQVGYERGRAVGPQQEEALA